MTSIHSYPSIFAIGHRAIADIFSSPVFVEEKIDGSQFSFGRLSGEFVCRSKGQQLIVSAPEKMFELAVNTAQSLDLHEDWVYRCEYLKSPKHNTLAYSRVPKNNLALFDVQTGLEQYLSPDAKAVEADRLGIECVPLLYHGLVSGLEQFSALLERESALGGCRIEGVVVKNYAVFTHEKKVAMGKFVSEMFKEKHATDWKTRNPTRADVVSLLISEFKTVARWRKAIQHLRDAGKLEDSPRDIGLLIKEIPGDVLSDSEAEIKDRLFAHFWPQIKRGITAGLPEFYKTELLARGFEK